jgi:excisionase family DNA binding protein
LNGFASQKTKIKADKLAVLRMNNTVIQSGTADAIFIDATAAIYVGGVEPRTIRDWRTRRGLPFIRITAKVIRIRRADLDRWLAQHLVAITRSNS